MPTMLYSLAQNVLRAEGFFQIMAILAFMAIVAI